MKSWEQRLFTDFFRDAPSEIDQDSIFNEWQALAAPYHIEGRHLPLPVWARRPLTDSGEQAWRLLSLDVPRIAADKPFAIYIHIPFCARRCSFCDCYSFHLKSHREKHITRYVELLKQEMRLWSDLGTLSERPISTVHFGGGTPTFLGPKAFAEIVNCCRELFNISPETEWALETTGSELSLDMIDKLEALGFTRLHVGVQSLEDAVREHLNRQESAEMVMRKLAEAISRHWIVSVDMIFGLPGQTLAGYLADLTTLSNIGVDGFSVYELQQSPRNRAFIQHHSLDQRPRIVNYFFAQAGGHHLSRLGYRKTLFNHYARERDTNLYFTFPERGEDLLAIGTIADGVFGDYHYRHPIYAPYSRQVTRVLPGLQGGLRRNTHESRLHPLFIELMGNRIAFATLNAIVPDVIRSQWQELSLISFDQDIGHFRLTNNGSWFLGNMISQLACL